MEPPSSRTAPAHETLYSSSACSVAVVLDLDFDVDAALWVDVADEAMETGVATTEGATASGLPLAIGVGAAIAAEPFPAAEDGLEPELP